MGFFDKMKDVLKEGVIASKDVLDKTKEKAKDLGEKGAQKIEMMKLEREAEKRFTTLGTEVYEILIKKGQSSVTKSTAAIKTLLKEISDIEKEIDAKEASYKSAAKQSKEKK